MNKQSSGWIITILGIWVLISAFLQFQSNAYFWIDLLDGAVIAIVGFATIPNNATIGWISGIIGLWLMVASFIGGLHIGSGLYWNNLLSGIVIAIMGLSELGQASPQAQTAT